MMMTECIIRYCLAFPPVDSYYFILPRDALRYNAVNKITLWNSHYFHIGLQEVILKRILHSALESMRHVCFDINFTNCNFFSLSNVH